MKYYFVQPNKNTCELEVVRQNNESWGDAIDRTKKEKWPHTDSLWATITNKEFLQLV
jgi:hypothetical protein